MNKKIIEILRSIETENKVRILFACESGSRVYGFESQDSDYDVRFIFVRPEEDYLCLEPSRDVIEKMIPEDKADVVGWDLKKALSLLGKSNPSLLEWLKSPDTYLRDPIFMKGISEIVGMCFDPSACFHHYYRMAVGHDSRYLERDGYTLKRFLYYARGILSCKWIMKNHSMPPLDLWLLFHELLKDVETESLYDDIELLKKGLKIIESLKDLLELKKKGKENDKATVDRMVVDYVEEVRKEVENYKDGSVKEKTIPRYKLDRLFIDTVRRVNDSFFCAEKNEEIHKVAHVEGEGFIFTYESEGQGCGKIGIGKGDERLSFSVYALQRNPLRNMVFGLVEIRDYHREEYNTWWYSTSGEIDLKMINKGSDLEIKLTILDQDFGIDKEYDWTLSLDEVIGAVLSAAKKALRTRGIVGLSKDWMEEDVAECDFFPFADFFALAGVDVKVEDGDIAHSSFEEEFRILQQLCE